MGLCRKKGWRYVFTQKDTRQKQVSEAYHWILEGECSEVKNIGKERGTGRYANDVGITAGKKEKMNVYECGRLKTKDSTARKTGFMT